ncbi:MAG: cyclic nucleotide-binding domain-containing protein [Anaerolineaceae bacterium]|nr:cyclic nucleotide-binding domain-containing protein [Anaerolineaceae bacterium]
MTSTKDIIKFLNAVPLFKGLNDKQLSLIAQRAVERNFKAGDTIVKQGQGGEGFFILSSGKAEAIHERNDGTKTVVNMLKTTDFFGELALLSEGMRTASIIALEDTTCIVLTRWDFRAVLLEDGEIAISILEEMANRFRKLLSTL